MAAPKFTADGILDAAAEEVASSGPAVRVADIARRLSAPNGSIYYRFSSRDEILVALWLRSIRRFHQAYLAAGEMDEAHEALLSMAERVVTFSRDNPREATAMTLFRQPRLVDNSPEKYREEVRHINDQINARLAELAARRYAPASATSRHQFLVRTAAIDIPYGLVRRHMWHAQPPDLPQVAVASAHATLALGDQVY